MRYVTWYSNTKLWPLWCDIFSPKVLVRVIWYTVRANKYVGQKNVVYPHVLLSVIQWSSHVSILMHWHHGLSNVLFGLWICWNIIITFISTVTPRFKSISLVRKLFQDTSIILNLCNQEIKQNLISDTLKW